MSPVRNKKSEIFAGSPEASRISNGMNRGFTLIESLVVFFIIGALSVLILWRFRFGQDNAVLARAAAAFETELRKVQNLAIVSTDFEGATPCGYGIHYFDNKRYHIYVGRLGGAASCRTSNHDWDSGTDSVYQWLKIVEPNVVFKATFSDIFFEPPDPTTYINNNRSFGVSATVQFCLERDLNKCRNLTIDTAGRISIQ